jgi:hypothetical protein
LLCVRWHFLSLRYSSEKEKPGKAGLSQSRLRLLLHPIPRREILKTAIGPQAEIPAPATVIGQAATNATSGQINGVAAITESPDSSVGDAGHGLRYSIRAVLRVANRGMRPRDVHGELVKRGTEFSEGKSSPLTRIYNELYRMSKVGQIRKRGSLYYPQETIQ